MVLSCWLSQPLQALQSLLREDTERCGGGVGFDGAIDVDLLDQSVGGAGGDFQSERIASRVNVPCCAAVSDVGSARSDVFAGISF